MPSLPRDFFEQIKERDSFYTLVRADFTASLEDMNLAFDENKSMFLDAYFQWMQDMERVQLTEEEVSEPDHIKKAAHLIYWLRRFSPVNEFRDINAFRRFDRTSTMGEFMLRYGREYLAFDIGYRAAAMHERSINGRNLDEKTFGLQSEFDDVPDHDLLITVCHVMKTKMLSPQALVIALKAIFLRR